MADFKEGDRVRLSAGADDDRRHGWGPHPGVGDLEGTVTGYGNGRPVVDWDGGEHGGLNNPREDEIELVPATYDQDTVNAIVSYFRGRSNPLTAKIIEDNFAVPQTRTVSVNFQVPEGESVVDYLENVGIDYDIEGGN